MCNSIILFQEHLISKNRFIMIVLCWIDSNVLGFVLFFFFSQKHFVSKFSDFPDPAGKTQVHKLEIWLDYLFLNNIFFSEHWYNNL